ncbi:MAG: prepilin-type N-terminal cleavage/methylation domain-containing protein [Myxococcales bacterium]|nr:prepilin-type N-terminal cleavage/methylation domain-containing protein [Myxococcales bacterium]
MPRTALGTATRSRLGPRRAVRRGRRGMSLIEVLVAIALVVLLTGGVMLGTGALGGARLKRSSSGVTAAVRVAYNHASATSRPTRLAFDFEARTVTLEQSDEKRMLVRKHEKSGGAAAANELEAEAIEAGERIVEGPRAPRPSFHPVEAFGLADDDGNGKSQKRLEDDVRFRQIEVGHEEEPVREGRVYLYFWPGGQTERAAIQIARGDEPTDDDIYTILVSPLTGRVVVESGAHTLPTIRDERDESDRSDPEGG